MKGTMKSQARHEIGAVLEIAGPPGGIDNPQQKTHY